MAGTSRGPFSKLFSGLIGGLSFGSSETAVGLSIGSSAIKLVELKKKGKVWELLHFGMVQLSDDLIVNREISQPMAVVESIKALVAGAKPQNKKICTSISGTSLMIKRLVVEVKDLKDLQEQIFWEAEQYLPFDASDVVMDYQILNQSPENRADVLLVAAKRSVVESYLSVVGHSGLKPKVLDVDFFAMQNYFEANYPVTSSEAVVLVDIGAVGMKLVVLSGGVPIFTKDSVLGGRNLTEEIQKNLNLNFADAEALKVGGYQTGLPQEVSDLMHLMCETYGTEIKRSIDFYQASSAGPPVSYILLSGGGAKVPNLQRVVQEVTRLPTQIANPFNSISYDQSVFENGVSDIAPIAAVPIGLALRAGAG